MEELDLDLLILSAVISALYIGFLFQAFKPSKSKGHK